MRLSSRNFTTKQIGSWWRVVGPGGKLLDGQYRLEAQALVALKLEVDKMLKERNFGFLKDAANRIDQTLIHKEQNYAKETKTSNDDGNGTNDKDRIGSGQSPGPQGVEGHQEGQESPQKDAEVKVQVKKEIKKGRRPTSIATQIARKHNLDKRI